MRSGDREGKTSPKSKDCSRCYRMYHCNLLSFFYDVVVELLVLFFFVVVNVLFVFEILHILSFFCRCVFTAKKFLMVVFVDVIFTVITVVKILLIGTFVRVILVELFFKLKSFLSLLRIQSLFDCGLYRDCCCSFFIVLLESY